jgi:hypothetical protein
MKVNRTLKDSLQVLRVSHRSNEEDQVMNQKNKKEVQEKPSAGAIPKIAELDIPSIAKALKEVYAIGSIPLTLIFVAAVVVFWLLVKGALTALPFLGYLVGFLIAAAVVVFLIINWLAYRKWRDEVNARIENRRLEIDLYVRLTASARETQDGFLLNVLKYTGNLAAKSDLTPDGRIAEINALAGSLGSLVNQFVDLRRKLELPELTAAFPQGKASTDTEINRKEP